MYARNTKGFVARKDFEELIQAQPSLYPKVLGILAADVRSARVFAFGLKTRGFQIFYERDAAELLSCKGPLDSLFRQTSVQRENPPRFGRFRGCLQMYKRSQTCNSPCRIV